MTTSQQVSSGSDSDPRYANMDERKRKRMISNRESARKSRMKKEQHLKDLLSEVSKLKSNNAQLSQNINTASQLYMAIESDNNVLRAQVMELSDRLSSLNSVLHTVEEVSGGLAMDIPGSHLLEQPWQLPFIPDSHLFEPWQLPFPIQHPIPNVFQC